MRVGFYAGDDELVEFLRAVRQHAGLMVPGPAQAAGVAALGDDEHVEAQRERYRERLAYLAGVLEEYGCPVPLPEGGFYLWVAVPPARWPDAWAMAEGLATDGGLLVSPGDLYGPGARRTSASPSSSRWTAWLWWGSASLGGAADGGGGTPSPPQPTHRARDGAHGRIFLIGPPVGQRERHAPTGEAAEA